MTHLTLAGVSEDGQRLRLVNDSGDEFTVEIDGKLRSALRGETARLGQLETKMDSALRPRDIQARIRAGESPESVAEAARTTVEKILPFAGPVLDERRHVAQRAQRSSLRRRSGESGSAARTLGEAVESHLGSQSASPDGVEWDAWRRSDGRWTVTGHFALVTRTGTAEFTFDPPGNFVTQENDDARWLVGELADPVPTPRRDDLDQRRRRLSAVPEDELPLGDDAIELVTEPEYVDQPLEAFLEEEPAGDRSTHQAEQELVEEATDAAARDEARDGARDEVRDEAGDEAGGEDEAATADEPPSRRPVKKSRGRASVPSWDEIMFGGGKQD